MKENNIIKALGLVVILAAIILAALLLVWNSQKVQGSVDTDSGGYYATSTRNSTSNAMASSTVLKTGQGILGSFVITGAGAAPVTFYDATTSNATLRTKTATSSLKVIANFPASTAAGTYTIDGMFYDGLLYDVTGASNSVPTSTITWK